MTGDVSVRGTVGFARASVCATTTDASELPGATDVLPGSLVGGRAILLHLDRSFVANEGAVTVVHDADAVSVTSGNGPGRVADGGVHCAARLASVEGERRRPRTVRLLEHDHVGAVTTHLANTRFSARQLACDFRLCARDGDDSAEQCWNQNDLPHWELRRGWEEYVEFGGISKESLYGGFHR